MSTFSEPGVQEIPGDYMQANKTNKINWYYNCRAMPVTPISLIFVRH